MHSIRVAPGECKWSAIHFSHFTTAVGYQITHLICWWKKTGSCPPPLAVNAFSSRPYQITVATDFCSVMSVIMYANSIWSHTVSILYSQYELQELTHNTLNVNSWKQHVLPIQFAVSYFQSGCFWLPLWRFLLHILRSCSHFVTNFHTNALFC